LLRGSEVGEEVERSGGGGWTVVNLIPLVFVAGYLVETRLCFECFECGRIWTLVN
jgi:hypothetical protein